MKKIDMSGIFPPIPTPFDQAGDLNLTALAANLERWNRYPLGGYVVLGTNGEFPYLSDREKLTFFAAARKSIPADKVFMAGTGCESTHATIALTKEAAQIGADVAILITPSYFKSKMDAPALTHYYYTVADASPIPVSVYNMPANTNVDMTAELIIKLSQHPNIAAVKESGGNLAKIGEIIHRAKPEFQVLAGSAGFLYPAYCLGAVGGVLALANIAPELCCRLEELFKQGKAEEARKLQLRLLAPNNAVTAKYGVAGLKAAMDMLGYYGGPPRSPLMPLGEADQAALKKILQEAGIL